MTHTNPSQVGRDKALRTVQYFSRFLSFYLYRQNYPQTTVAQFTALKSNLGLVRKAMRLGKFVEHLRAAALAFDSKTMDPVLKYLAVARQMGYAGYLFSDALTYLDAAGVRKSEGAKRMQKQAYQFWAMGLAASAISGIYSLYKISAENKRVVESQGTDAEKKVEGKKVLRYVGCFFDKHVCHGSTIANDSQEQKRCYPTIHFGLVRLDRSRQCSGMG